MLSSTSLSRASTTAPSLGADGEARDPTTLGRENDDDDNDGNDVDDDTKDEDGDEEEVDDILP